MPIARINQGMEPTNVLLQCKTIVLSASAKTNEERIFLFESVNAYICAASAIGANHHFPIGSKAPLRRIPERAERRTLTKLCSPT
jgi:hypothetical protein